MVFVNSTGETDEYKDIVENLVRAIGTSNMVDIFPVSKMFDSQGIKTISTTYVKKMLHIKKNINFHVQGAFCT